MYAIGACALHTALVVPSNDGPVVSLRGSTAIDVVTLAATLWISSLISRFLAFQERHSMTVALIVALAGSLVACVFVLGREIRLRKALQKLLRLILSRWRTNVAHTDSQDVALRSPHGSGDDSGL